MRILDWLFRDRAEVDQPTEVTCPWCGRTSCWEDEVNACPQCQARVSPIYRRDHLNMPPMFIEIAGRSQVGKTMYLRAVRRTMKVMDGLWTGFFSQPLTESTFIQVREDTEEESLPAITSTAESDQLQLLLQNLPRWGPGRTLVTRDCAGEHFQEWTFEEARSEYLKRVRTNLLMIDARERASMQEIFTSYITSLAEVDPQFDQGHRRVVIILSKGDTIDLPPHLKNYLESDPMLRAFAHVSAEAMGEREMAEYVEVMGRASDAIQDWLVGEGAARSVVNMAKQYNIELRFSIVTSTGYDIQGGAVLDEVLQPMRVLDPLFWALEFDEQLAD